MGARNKDLIIFEDEMRALADELYLMTDDGSAGEKGLATAEKKAGRIAAEGMVYGTSNDAAGVVVEINSETDFVGKNADFQAFVKKLAEIVAKENPADVDAHKALPYGAEGNVGEALTALIAKIGENMNIRRFEKVVAENGCVVTYTHGGGRIGVIVEAETEVVSDTVKEGLTNIAMQIAALNPKYISTDEVSEEYKEHEKAIIAEQIKNDPKMAGKPEKVIEGAVNGRLNKELKEVCLLEQAYVKAEDGKQTVKQYIDALSKENNATVSLKKFVRFETGEGIEKKVDDFAAEVAAQVAGK